MCPSLELTRRGMLPIPVRRLHRPPVEIAPTDSPRHKIAPRPELAADLAAETFAAALQALPHYGEPPGHARGWLFAIATDKLADSARRGAVADRSRRELGMAACELTDSDLERVEELLDAQRLAPDLAAVLTE